MEGEKRKVIVLIGPLDTKGLELGYINEQLVQHGYTTIVIDVSLLGSPPFKPDISREKVAEAAGVKFEDLGPLAQEDAWDPMTRGAVSIVQELYHSGKLHGIISVGGSMGTSLATAAMRVLPLGLPKVMVSTVASADVHSYVGTKDITMIHSVADIQGLNMVTKRILTTAAGAIMGMVDKDPGELKPERPLIGISARGINEPCVTMLKKILEQSGFEGVCFHATGTGGQALEEWLDQGLLHGVLDMSPVDSIEHLFGGRFAAGPDRLESAGRRGIPQVIGTCGIGWICYDGVEKVPEQMRDRNLRVHNPQVVVARLNKKEMAFVGQFMADKLNKSIGATAVLIPKRGFAGGGWDEGYDPEEDLVFIESLKSHLKPSIDFVELDAHINDRVYAERAVALLLELLRQGGEYPTIHQEHITREAKRTLCE